MSETPPITRKRRILVVDDDHDNLHFFRDLLLSEEYLVEIASSGDEALHQIDAFNPELVILDYNMPGLNGLETLQMLRRRQNYVAVIFVSGESESDLIVNCLRGGADDYIQKPFNYGELLARIRVRFRNKDVNDQLEVANNKLKDMAEKDDLTGLYNMRFIYEKIEQELKRARRYKRNVACIMMDLDHFKSVNDEFDHLFGSHVLREIGQLIQRSMRETDFAARYGGDEFLMVLTEAEMEGTQAFAERVRSMVEAHVCTDGKNTFSRTASLGFAIATPEEDLAARDLVRRADHALYEAKETGRNRVVGYSTTKVLSLAAESGRRR